jgi:hypothetical protein
MDPERVKRARAVTTLGFVLAGVRPVRTHLEYLSRLGLLFTLVIYFS